MRQDLVDILSCPVCKAELRLDIAAQEAGEVLRGTLTCTQCGEVYPIDEGIPNLLPPDLRTAMCASSDGPTGH